MELEPESDLGKRIAALSPAQRATLLQKFEKSGEASARDGLRRRAPGQPALLSFAQERLWFLAALDPTCRAYNLGKAYHLSGPLDVEALGKSIEEILRRHEALRTTFVSGDGNPIQVVAPHGRFRLAVHDVSGASRQARREEALKLAEEEVSRSFDLAVGPLMRTTLLRLEPLEHTLVLACHHIVFDGWSGGLFDRELSAFYSAFSKGQRPDWPDLRIQYADYAAWQRLRLSEEKIEACLAFWREQLADASPLALPTDRSRPARPTHEGGRHFFALPSEVAEKLSRFNREEKVTPFMTLFAAFAVLLFRRGGGADIMVGTPIANRLDMELEGLIGFFVNTLVMRVNLGDEPSFRELVRRVRRIALDAFQNQELPFEKLVEELRPPRDVSRHPLFQVAFALQNANEECLALRDLEVSKKFLRSSASRFDLELHCVRDGDGWLALFVYARELFDETTIAAMAGQYTLLLEAMLARPERSIGLVPMLSERERERIVLGWNTTEMHYPRDLCIHELFAEQARRRPEALAVVFGREKLTYGELDLGSSRLAGYLRRLGVEKGARVAISMEPSCEVIVGLLGILKVGAAYVPIDPRWPRERIGFTLVDSAAEVLLTQERLLGRFSCDTVKKVCLDAGWNALERFDEVRQESSGTEGSAVAFVMYTSGSTGTPKGVCVPHRAVSRLVINSDYIQLGSEDVVAQIANYCFDAATFEIWGALLNGSRLVGIERESVLSAEKFSAELALHGVTTLLVTTALFNELAHERADIFCSVRNVLFGGEECDAKAVRKVIESGSSPRRLLNAYGPTETTTLATWYEVTAGQNWEGKIPIGRPVGNTQVYILDDHLNPVPAGVAGEICIGGDGVADGYLNRPDLTAERFIASPFIGGRRLYRTGDLGRFLSDGNIEFLGRRDDQVKIRGFRIELGEIEEALVSHEAVRQAVICVRESGPTEREKRLVAYVVPNAGHNTPKISEDLNAFLKQKLPDYMVPSTIVVLERLPLTPNGKIDRNALPAPVRASGRPSFVAPRSETEKMVAEVWSAMIDIEHIGIDEDFFQLGGHSLLAMRVVSKLRSVSGTDIPLRVFFENATVAAIAEYIEGAQWTVVCGPLAPAILDREEIVL
jgi:amino acid adenylation domain-containing protein